MTNLLIYILSRTYQLNLMKTKIEIQNQTLIFHQTMLHQIHEISLTAWRKHWQYILWGQDATPAGSKQSTSVTPTDLPGSTETQSAPTHRHGAWPSTCTHPQARFYRMTCCNTILHRKGYSLNIFHTFTYIKNHH